MVITEAGDHEKVQSLVYVAALAPQLGQSLGEASKMDVYPTAGVGAIKPDADGYLYLPKEAVAKYFAPDLSAEDTAFMAASQGMLNSQAMGQKTTKAAWKSKPSFYAIAGDDQMIPTKLQREFAESIGATTEEIKSSHAIMLSNPDFVASLIIKAAK
jgi:pimeloyl-ACP methyl ester carboxylesterase